MKCKNSGDNGRNHHDNNNNDEDEDDLTAAEKRSRKFKQMREKKEMEQVVRWVNYFLDMYCFGLQCVCSVSFDWLTLYWLAICTTCISVSLSSMSHRERVEQFNEKLGQLTELNDIPRVSAAGNG